MDNPLTIGFAWVPLGVAAGALYFFTDRGQDIIRAFDWMF